MRQTSSAHGFTEITFLQAFAGLFVSFLLFLPGLPPSPVAFVSRLFVADVGLVAFVVFVVVVEMFVGMSVRHFVIFGLDLR